MKLARVFHFLALGAHGSGLSGGDRIFIELAREWSKHNKIFIYVTEEGKEMCDRQNLEGKNIEFVIIQSSRYTKYGFTLHYLIKILQGIIMSMKLKVTNFDTTYIYSASEFWMDSLSSFILKIRHPKVRWIATWYQTAPNPIKGFTEMKRENKYRINSILYWIAQFPVKYLINYKASKVLVNNENEKIRFPKFTKTNRTIVLIGAIPLEQILSYQKLHRNVTKRYEAVFQGRFHAQKGVLELINIWKEVVRLIPNAKLAMIGDGPLMKDVRLRITDLGLNKNIQLFGYVFDGDKKYKIFSQSKIVVHPAFYDSGGMASAEAMAFGLPVVGFDLISYKSYYPKGMLKVNDVNNFAQQILILLKDDAVYQKYSKEATSLTKSNWSWENRASEVYKEIIR